MGRNMFVSMIEALSDKHGQMDLRFEDLTLSAGGTGMSVTMSGTITVQAHMRELADEERAAHVQHNVAALKT